jgi:hypothetical protein
MASALAPRLDSEAAEMVEVEARMAESVAEEQHRLQASEEE